jgi:hypothetical protein
VRDGSEGIFLFAGDVDTADNLFQTYDGFAITVDGHIWWEVSLELTEADEDYYQGNLTTVNSAFFENKDRKIGEIVTATLDMPNESFTAFKTRWNDPADSVMRFPKLNFYSERVNFQFDVPFVGVINFSTPLANNTEFFLVPTFKWIWIIKQCLNEIGVTVVDNVIDLSNDFVKRLLLASNRTIDQRANPNDGNVDFTQIGNRLKVSDFLPEITLSQLIKDFCLYANCRLSLKSDGSIELTSIQRLIDQPVSKQIKTYDPNISIMQTENQTIGIDYQMDDGLDELPETGYRGEYNTLAAFKAISSPQNGDYGFVKEFNRFYIYVQRNTQLTVRFLSHPYQPFTGDYTYTPQIKPVTKDRYTYDFYSEAEMVEQSGKIRVLGEFIASVGMKVYFLLEKQNDSEFDPYGIAGTITDIGTGYIDTDIDYEGKAIFRTVKKPKLSYDKAIVEIAKNIGRAVVGKKTNRRDKKEIIQDPKDIDSKIIIAFEHPTLFAVINNAIHYPELGQVNKSFAGAALLWHGNINGYDSNPHGSAWADPWDQTGSEIGTVSFNTTGPVTIFNTIIERMVSFMQNTRLFRIRANETEQTIRTIYDVKKLRGLNFTGIFARFRCEITEQGLENQEIEVWRN